MDIQLQGKLPLDVLIIGGGIAGLSAAWRLQRENPSLKFQILEASSRLGGKIQTENAGNIVWEDGPDSFITVKNAALELCRELGLENELVPIQKTKEPVAIWKGGRMHSLPAELMLARPPKIKDFFGSSILSFSAKLRAALEPFMPKGSGGDETVREFISRRLGAEFCDSVIQPLVSGVYAGDAAKLSLKSVFPRLWELEAKYGSLWAGFKKAPRASAFSGDTPSFMSLKGGMKTLVEALEAKLPAERLVLNKRIRTFSGRIGNDYVFLSEDGETFQTRSVIFAIPSYAAAHPLGMISSAVINALQSIPHASSAVISLLYEKKDLETLKGFGFLVPACEKMTLLGASFISNKFPHRCTADYALIRCFVGGAGREAGAEMSDESLLQTVQSELKTVLGLCAKPAQTRIRRWVKANPQYETGHADKIRRLEEQLFSLGGIYLAGASYHGIGIPDCISSGKRAASGALNFLSNP